jgi:hypothetical protein
MNITYLDADTREVIDVIDDPAPVVSQISAEQFAASLRATIVRILPASDENEWNVELKIPSEVRRLRYGEGRMKHYIGILDAQFECDAENEEDAQKILRLQLLAFMQVTEEPLVILEVPETTDEET